MDMTVSTMAARLRPRAPAPQDLDSGRIAFFFKAPSPRRFPARPEVFRRRIRQGRDASKLRSIREIMEWVRVRRRLVWVAFVVVGLALVATSRAAASADMLHATYASR